MNGEHLRVRHVQGRHAADGGKILSGNVEAQVVEEESHRLRIRIDDDENPEFWLEVLLEVER